MKQLPHIILIVFCAFFIAADDPQQPAFNNHETVAKAYYAQVQQAAEEQAGSRASEAMPEMATGLVVDRQGKAVSGASVAIGGGARDAVLGEGTTDASGRFQITLSAQSDKGLSLTVTKSGFNRWAFGGIDGGIAGHRVRLDREVDKGFLKGLIDEKDQERRLWKLLEVVGDRQFPTEIHDLFPHIGTLRDDLLQLVQSKAFEAEDGRHSSPAERACSLLAYWHDPTDDSIFGGWLKNQRHIKHPMRKQFVGKTITEVCRQWANHHFGETKPGDRTFNEFSKPLLDPSGNHALVQFWVEYKIWGYSQLIVMTKQQGEWQLRFVADGHHWHKQPNAEEGA